MKIFHINIHSIRMGEKKICFESLIFRQTKWKKYWFNDDDDDDLVIDGVNRIETSIFFCSHSWEEKILNTGIIWNNGNNGIQTCKWPFLKLKLADESYLWILSKCSLWICLFLCSFFFLILLLLLLWFIRLKETEKGQENLHCWQYLSSWNKKWQ